MTLITALWCVCVCVCVAQFIFLSLALISLLCVTHHISDLFFVHDPLETHWCNSQSPIMPCSDVCVQDSSGVGLSCWCGGRTSGRESQKSEAFSKVSVSNVIHDMYVYLVMYVVSVSCSCAGQLACVLLSDTSCPAGINQPRWTCATSNWRLPRRPWWTSWQRTLTTSGPETAHGRDGPTASCRSMCV